MAKIKNYVDRIFVNGPQSISMGSVCAFDGIRSIQLNDHKTFLEFGDCRRKIRLQWQFTEAPAQYINKIALLNKQLISFTEHLKKYSRSKPEKWYVNRIWLNPLNSDRTDSFYAFDGYHELFKPNKRRIFMEIADCNTKIRFHKVHDDKVDDVILKNDKIIILIKNFIEHLKKNT